MKCRLLLHGWLPGFAIAALLSSCAWEPRQQPVPGATPADPVYTTASASRLPLSAAEQAARTARAQVGTPYKWGGHNPGGFDCSGLIYFAYAQANVAVPRTSSGQRAAARPVDLAQARAGDVLFFAPKSKINHVGMYLGDGRFVHAPASGKRVVIAELSNPYYRRNLRFVGRLGDRH